MTLRQAKNKLSAADGALNEAIANGADDSTIDRLIIERDAAQRVYDQFLPPKGYHHVKR